MMDFTKTGKLAKLQNPSKILALLVSITLIFSPISYACTGFSVVSGGYDSCTQDANGNMTFQGLQDGTIFNWNGFNIAASQTFSFLFNIAGGSVLNNDLSGFASNILGNLFSNGYVFIINPAGINIGASAMIDVGGLVASTLTISNENFLAHNYTFENGAQAGAVINHGTITAQPGGFVALLGSSIENTGQIVAQMGSIALAVGETITLTFDPNGLINLAIPQLLADKIRNDSEVAIANSGLLKADGGKVLLRADAVQNLFDHLINNAGIIEANSVAIRNGVIELTANGGDINNSGMINASGTIENPNGGSIRIEGDNIFQDGIIRANSIDYGLAGNINIEALYNIWLRTGSLTEARGTGEISHGGRVHIYSHGNGYFEEGATIDISGTGNGGSGEFSAQDQLEIGGIILGLAGEGYQMADFLFDPPDIVFSGNSVCAASCKYEATNNITFKANATVSAPSGSLKFIADSDASGVGTITMGANSSASARDFIYMDGSGSATIRTLSVTGPNGIIQIGNNHPGLITFKNVTTSGPISAAAGVLIKADLNVTIGGIISSINGLISLIAGQDVAINQNMTAGGNIDIQAKRNITVAANQAVSGNNVTLTADSDNNLVGNLTMKAGSGLTALRDVSIRGFDIATQNVTSNGGNILMNAARDLTLNGVTTASNGNVNLSSGRTLTANQSITGNTVTLMTDSDNDLVGNLVMNAGSSILATTGDVTIDGSQTVTLRDIRSTAGAIKIGTLRQFANITASGNLTANSDIVMRAGTNITTNGLLSTTNGMVDLNAGQDVALNQNVTASNGNINISAGRNFTVGAGSILSGNNLFLTADSNNDAVGTFQMNDGSRLLATNNILVSAQAITLQNNTTFQNSIMAGGDVTMNGKANLTVGNNWGIIGNNVLMTADSNNDLVGNFSMGTGSSISATNNLSVSGAGSITLRALAAGNDLSITSTNGSILDDSNQSTQLSANNVTLFAHTGIGAANVADIDLHTNTLTATAQSGSIFAANDQALTVNSANSTGGSITIAAAGDLMLNSANATGGSVTITATGNLIANSVSASGTGANNITLSSTNGNVTLGSLTAEDSISVSALTGGIFDDLNEATKLTITGATGLLNLTALNGIGSGVSNGALDLNIGATRIGAIQSTGGGDIFLRNDGGLTIAAGDLLTSGSINLTVGGASTITSLTGIQNLTMTVTNGNLTIGTLTANGNVDLTTANGSILDDGSSGTQISANVVNLTASNFIGTSASQVATNANFINTNAGGGIWVREANSATFSGTSASGDIHFTTTTGDLTAGNVSTLGNIFLTALAGDVASQASTLVSGNVVTLVARSIGSQLARLFVNANIINATANNGSIYMTESNEAFLNANSSAANGTIDVISTTGDLTLGTVNAGTGAVNLQATNGSILDGNGSANNITAGSNSTLMAAGTIGVTGDGLDVNITNGATLTTLASGQDANGTSVNLDGVIDGQEVDPGANLNFGLPNNPPSGFVFFNSHQLFPIASISISPVVGPVIIGVTDLLSPLFSQSETRRKPALFAF